MSSTPLTLLKLCVCFLHDMRMCMWFAYNCCINFCQFSPFIYRLCEHIPYNTIPILCPLLKWMLHCAPPPNPPPPTPHHPPIQGQVRHRSPRNSGCMLDFIIFHHLTSGYIQQCVVYNVMSSPSKHFQIIEIILQ